MNMHIGASYAALTPPRAAQSVEVSAAPHLLQPFARIKRWPRDQEILHQGNGAEDWYCVVSGACRQCLVRPDGRRRIIDILLPGDFFGFTMESAHHFGAQAIAEDTFVASYSRRQLEAAADSNPQIAREIRERAFSTISRLQEHILVVGTMTAPEKVRAFLNQMLQRLPTRDSSITLPVSRYDIADQLGISVETVCRAITVLKASGAIHLGGPRNVEIFEPRRPDDV